MPNSYIQIWGNFKTFRNLKFYKFFIALMYNEILVYSEMYVYALKRRKIENI